MNESFEWDSEKAEANESKHGIAFAEAQTVCSDPLLVIWPDPEHSWDEERAQAIGTSYLARLLVVMYTERGDCVRIISARRATRREVKTYAQ